MDKTKNFSTETVQEDDGSICLTLSLSIGSQPQPQPQQQPPPSQPPLHFQMLNAASWPLATTPYQPMLYPALPPQHSLQIPVLPLARREEPPMAAVQPPRQRGRVAGSRVALNRRGKAQTITPPYPWATDRRAVVHSYSYLVSNGMRRITGEVQCKECERRYEMQFDLESKFAELWDYIVKNRCRMHNRAPNQWQNPVLPDCRHCKQAKCVRPVSTKKKAINWLFLLLGQLIGCCKLSELKYFCKHTRNHRTGAKDRLLYSTYMGLCKQLDSKGPFHM